MPQKIGNVSCSRLLDSDSQYHESLNEIYASEDDSDSYLNRCMPLIKLSPMKKNANNNRLLISATMDNREQPRLYGVDTKSINQQREAAEDVSSMKAQMMISPPEG